MTDLTGALGVIEEALRKAQEGLQCDPDPPEYIGDKQRAAYMDVCKALALIRKIREAKKAIDAENNRPKSLTEAYFDNTVDRLAKLLLDISEG